MKHKFKLYLVITLSLFLNIGFIQCSDDDPVSPNKGSDETPLVKITDQLPDSIQLDSFNLKDIEITGDIITLNLTHGGGCKEHNYSLFMSPVAFLESQPVQANLYLQHNSNGDACEALIDTNVSFNLRSIAELYQTFYGRNDEIIINVFDYFEEEPANKLSASYLPDNNELGEIQAELNNNLSKWASKSVTDYQYTFRWSCFCTEDFVKPVIISVRNGMINTVVYVDSGNSVDESHFGRYRTVEELFDFIQDAIDEKAYEISVSYDPELGYPTSASIDYSKGIIDEEMAFTVYRLELE